MNRPGESVLESARLDEAVILLASNSPRRRQLLALTGWGFRVAPADVDENPLAGESPRDHALRLAQTKALALLPATEREAFIVAADTIVVDREGNSETILGKPESPDEAVEVLKRLRGRAHQVYTALAVLRTSDEKLLTDLCVTQVPMRRYSDAEILAYVASGDPLDKAGAYAIQHTGFHPVVSLEGCFASVMGLPLCHLARTLLKLGANPPMDVPSACQAALEYACPIFQAVAANDEVG